MTTPSKAIRDSLQALLPDQVEGWKAEGPGEVCDRDGLFDLINGGAEVYRELNVQAVLDRSYAKAKAADLIVDLFDMGSPTDAYAAYRNDIREEAGVAGVGVESEYQGGTLFFWKGRYFVSLVALQETENTKAALVALGRHIDRAIPEAGKPPELVRELPQQGLDQSQLYFFHTHRSLARRYPLAEDNLLGLSAQTEVVLARYPGDDSGPTLLLLVRYPRVAQATAALEQLRLRRFAGKPGIHRSPTGRHEGAAQHDAKLALVLEAKNEKTVTDLLGKLASPTRRKGGTR